MNEDTHRTGDDLLSPGSPEDSSGVTFDRERLGNLFDALMDAGYAVMGPTIRDGAIVYRKITRPDELPAGWTDMQEGGTYSLRERDDRALFGYNVGPDSWKRILHPPRVRQFSAARTDGEIEVQEEPDEFQKTAFLGVRACELKAIAIQDRVLLEGPYVDEHYKHRRESVLLIAVNCTQAGRTCFCVSMGSGPRATNGFDIALTEVVEDDRHYFVAEAGSPAGRQILNTQETVKATPKETGEAARRVRSAEAQMGRIMNTENVRDLLYDNLEHPRWDEVASRCLTCGNCTMVCPTCFCTTVEDVTDLSGEHAERWRIWDSCFSLDFSSIHGGHARSSAKSRYRQWMTHKLASWIDQFDSSGCVGCGRCITWCPVGIDITEEVSAIRKNPTPLIREAREKEET
jgi:ferredoxin